MADADDRATLISLAPGLTNVDPARVSAMYAYMRTQIRADLGPYALAWAVAHGLAMADRGASAAGGPVTMEREGDLQRTYSAPLLMNTNSEFWRLTSYGMQYLRILRSHTFGARNRMVGSPSYGVVQNGTPYSHN